MADDCPVGSPRKKIKVSLVDHTYHDWSQLEIQDDDDDDVDIPSSPSAPVSTQRRGIENFPAKLHKILQNPARYGHIIRWMPHGRSWTILEKDLLSSFVCPENFSHNNFDSFNRSVNGWGFKRLMREGPDHKSYYHECFLRGRPDLTKFMTRLVNPGKRLPDPKGEPNFYKMSRDFPLPEIKQEVQEAMVPHQGFQPGYPPPQQQPQPGQGALPNQPPFYPGYPYGYQPQPQGAGGMVQYPPPMMMQLAGAGMPPGFPYQNPYPPAGAGMQPVMSMQPGMQPIMQQMHPGMQPGMPQFPWHQMQPPMPQPGAAFPQYPYPYPPGQYGPTPVVQGINPQQFQQGALQQWGQTNMAPPGYPYQFPPNQMAAASMGAATPYASNLSGGSVQSASYMDDRKPAARKRQKEEDLDEEDEEDDDDDCDAEDEEEDDDDRKPSNDLSNGESLGNSGPYR